MNPQCTGCALIRVVLIIAVLTVCSCDRPPAPPNKPVAGEDKGSSVVKPTPEENTGPQSVVQAIRRRGELRVGMEVGFVPFQMLGPQGALEGFDVDAAHEAARAMGVGLRIIRREWGDLIPSLQASETDVVMSGMTITPDRHMEALFTDPVLETGMMFLVHRKNADRFKRFSDLNKPGVFIVFTRESARKLPIEELAPRAGHRRFTGKARGLEEVIQQRAHAYVDDEFSIRLMSAKHPDALLGRFEPITKEAVAWAVRPGADHWLNWLNNFIRGMRRDGRLDELKKKWLQDYYLDLGAKL